MEVSQIIPHIEALIFASEKPISVEDILEVLLTQFPLTEPKITLEQVISGVKGIQEKYESDFYSFSILESGGGWQFLTKKDYYNTVARLNGEKYLKKLSNAALETLAIIAYKQPITKGEMEAIRGVNCDYSVQKLLEKDLIVISGRNEELPGHPLIYETSKNFMDYFGINSAEDLPKIDEILSEVAQVATEVVGFAEKETVITEQPSSSQTPQGLSSNPISAEDSQSSGEQALNPDEQTPSDTTNSFN